MKTERKETVNHPDKKFCWMCRKWRKLKYFYKYRSGCKKGKAISGCIDCHTERNHSHYAKCSVAVVEQHRMYRNKKRRKLNALKRRLGCKKCGENDPWCLQFHHRDPKKKTWSICKLYGGTWSWERILEEVKKCIVLCANCHIKEHRRLDAKRRAQARKEKRTS